MKLSIDVKDRKEREAIRRAMALPDIRAFVITIGVLDALPTSRSRTRVLRYVHDLCQEKAANEMLAVDPQ